MKPFAYRRAASLDDALAALATPDASLIAGGMDLVPLLHAGLAQPATLIDIARLPDLAAVRVETDGGLWLGATATLARVAAHPDVRARFRVLAEAIDASASPQVRNLATIGGNLLQQPRCWYYRDPVFECLRRDGGTTCSALSGASDHHAIFDTQAPCIAVHPSDPATALAALGAEVALRSPRGERRVAVGEFFVAPQVDPTRATVLAHDELIVGLAVPPPPLGAQSAYVKIRDRAAFAFALVSAAAVIARDDAIVTHARLALGGVAWGPRQSAEAGAALIGGPLTPERIAAAVRLALVGVAPLPETEYKVALAEAALRRAIQAAGA